MIRLADKKDMEDILAIVKIAKQYMKESGNVTQWAGVYPGQEDFQEDIDKASFMFAAMMR